MDDANYLMSHIRTCNDIDIKSKQIYMDLIDRFIMELVKLINNGIKKIGDKDISMFISKLSK